MNGSKFESNNSKAVDDGVPTSEQVFRWMEETRLGKNNPGISEAEGKDQYDSVLREYRKLLAIVEHIDSDEETVALVGVAINRVFGP